MCGELMQEQAIFCEICSLICHDHCKKSAFSCPPKVNEQQPSYDVSRLCYIHCPPLCNRFFLCVCSGCSRPRSIIVTTVIGKQEPHKDQGFLLHSMALDEQAQHDYTKSPWRRYSKTILRPKAFSSTLGR